MTRASRPAAAMSALVSARPERMACGPVSHRNPSRRSLRMTPPARASASSSVTSWPAATRRSAAVRPAMPPPTTTIFTSGPPPLARRREGELRERADERGVRAHGACAREARDARALGVLLVEDVDLLQRLDVLAREGDRHDDDGLVALARDGVERLLGRRAEPALRADAALEA